MISGMRIHHQVEKIISEMDGAVNIKAGSFCARHMGLHDLKHCGPKFLCRHGFEDLEPAVK